MKEKEFNLSEKRKEAFSWAVCMDSSGNAIDEIIEYLKDEVEKQDEEFIKRLKKGIHDYNETEMGDKGRNDFIDKLAGDL